MIWAQSRKDGGEMLEQSEEKFTLGEMIFGAVTVRGLVQENAPIFISDLKKTYDPAPKTVNSQMYADLIDDKISGAVKKLYPRGHTEWQDDCATIHRTDVGLTAVFNNFSHRIPYELQSPKMAYVWPIVNIWSILKQDLEKSVHSNIEDLRKPMRASWLRISEDKDLCKRLISSIPEHLAAVKKAK